MDPARRQRVEEIFGAAMEHPPASRAEAVAAACGDDRELRREALSILDSSDSAADYFTDLASRAGVTPRAEADGSRMVGRTVSA